MDVHPKYVKIEKVGIFSRLINAGRAFADAIVNSAGFFLNAPLNALEAFAENEVEVIDKQLMLEDAQKDAGDGDEDEVIKLQIEEPEEPWQKKHREIYKEDDE